ncbi:MAG TPA: twin-arginine translocase TatA/TatE family subunit [Candidatus Baltobacteraceae bacterium]|jgi:TatA/E family protein of Tat protein translocase|nr:twin-arginine translocase TatA/TatE family subunit [Candidatus Baltobacteraceae bacterium]
MSVHPLLALFSPEIIGIIVIGAVLLFGAEKLPKLARSAGQAKKEFLMGQAEADAQADRAREQARVRAQTADSDIMQNVSQPNAAGVGENVPPPTPDKGTLSS